MTSITGYLPLLRGVTNGATCAYLTDQMNDSPDQRTTLALQVAHLFLSTAGTLCSAGIPLGVFGTIVKTACALTPVAVVADVFSKEVIPFSEVTRNQLNLVYKTGIIVNSVALFALGSPVCAIASLAMLALDTVASGQLKNVFDVVKKVAAIAALVGFGAQSFAAKGAMASMAAGSAVVVGAKGLLGLMKSSTTEKIILPEPVAVVEKKVAQAVPSVVVDLKEPVEGKPWYVRADELIDEGKQRLLDCGRYLRDLGDNPIKFG